MKKNIRLKLLPGQMVLVEDVTDYVLDGTGLMITCQETTIKKVGDEMKTFVNIVKRWFNTSAVLTFAEEFVEA